MEFASLGSRRKLTVITVEFNWMKVSLCKWLHDRNYYQKRKHVPVDNDLFNFSRSRRYWSWRLFSDRQRQKVVSVEHKRLNYLRKQSIKRNVRKFALVGLLSINWWYEVVEIFHHGRRLIGWQIISYSMIIDSTWIFATRLYRSVILFEARNFN